MAKKVDTDDKPVDVGTKHTKLKLAGSVATVHLQGCAGVVHVEGDATGSTVALAVSLGRDGNYNGYGRTWLWLVARSRVSERNSAREERRGNAMGDAAGTQLAVFNPVVGIVEMMGMLTCSSVAVK